MAEVTSRITARGCNRATLARQMLLQRAPVDVATAVRRLLALQAQQPASPYLALWNRVEGFDPEELDAALTDTTVVKVTSLRITLHLVHRDDLATIRQVMRPTLRAARLGDRRFTGGGLTAADADGLIADLLAFADRPRTTADLEAWLHERVGEAAAGAWWALRTVAPLRHAVTGGPWGFGYRPSYVAAHPDGQPDGAGGAGQPGGAGAPDAEPVGAGGPDEQLPRVIVRYLGAFGPASVADIARFTMVTRTRLRAAVSTLGDALEHLEGPEGAPLLDVPGGARPADDTPAPPRLLPMWDSVLLAYDDRARVVPGPWRRLVIRTNGDVLPTVLVDGAVAGVWRPVDGDIEVTAFTRFDDATWQGLAEEADGLRALLAVRDPSTYSRYRHWWEKLPDAEVVRLP